MQILHSPIDLQNGKLQSSWDFNFFTREEMTQKISKELINQTLRPKKNVYTFKKRDICHILKNGASKFTFLRRIWDTLEIERIESFQSYFLKETQFGENALPWL